MTQAPKWQLGLFDLLAVNSAGKNIVCTTAGWYCEQFGIDPCYLRASENNLFRVYVISHLGTGYSICAFVGSEDEAIALAEEFEGVGDWDFVDPAGIKALVPAIREIFRTRPGILDPHECLPRNWLREKAR